MLNSREMLSQEEYSQYVDEVPNLANDLNNLWLQLEGGYRKMYGDIKKRDAAKARKIWEQAFPIWMHVDRYASETGLDDESIVARMSNGVSENERTEISKSLLPLYCYLRHEGFTKKEITS
jgi:hypothetical protein